MRDVFFKPRIGAIEGAYCGLSGDLVMLREASLPDVCVVCGTPAHGNVYRAEFYPHRWPRWHVPIFYDIAYWIIGTCYVVDFPFCSICTSENFDIQPTWINREVGFFSSVSNTFLKLLPRIPLELAAQLQGTRTQQVLRFLMR
jgi:hypothetical protein